MTTLSERRGSPRPITIIPEHERSNIWEHKTSRSYNVNDRVTATEALADCGLDFPVELVPKSGYSSVTGTRVDLPDQYMIVGHYQNEPVYYGDVTNRYTLLRATDLAWLLEDCSRQFPVVSAGSDKKGKIIYFVLYAGTSEVAGEQIENHFIISDRRDGKGRLSFRFLPVRRACTNGLLFGLSGRGFNLHMTHTSSLLPSVHTFTQEAVPNMLSQQTSTLDILNKFAQCKITPDQATGIFERAYPYKKLTASSNLATETFQSEVLANRAYDSTQLTHLESRQLEFQNSQQQERERQDKKREYAQRLYNDYNQSFQTRDLDNTCWSAINAVTELQDHRQSGDSRTNAMFSPERIQAKTNAFDACRELLVTV